MFSPTIVQFKWPSGNSNFYTADHLARFGMLNFVKLATICEVAQFANHLAMKFVTNWLDEEFCRQPFENLTANDVIDMLAIAIFFNFEKSIPTLANHIAENFDHRYRDAVLDYCRCRRTVEMILESRERMLETRHIVARPPPQALKFVQTRARLKTLIATSQIALGNLKTKMRTFGRSLRRVPNN
ncbi:unnamed protein product [Caenorhabditis bovis]|uniref:Uncharacterized protein n=1 Tax=Caenorhabditis bovis TaxID=2654633 RepID=A0A8S1F4D3_9PELO|nr:unnamed protein product [Caenorhabditis bovis]